MANSNTTKPFINKKDKKSFKFPLGYFAGEKHRCAIKPIESNNFLPAFYDVYDSQGNLVCKQGQKPQIMFTMDWEAFGKDEINLQMWASDFPHIINNSIVPSKDELENIEAQRDYQYEIADESDSKSESAEALLEAKQLGRQLWAMKAKRLGYYKLVKGEQVIAEDEARIGESQSVTDLKEQENDNRKNLNE